MPILTPHWDRKPKHARQPRTIADHNTYVKRVKVKKYDPSKMTMLERSSLERSKLAWLHKNKDIKIGGPWGPIIARRVARCIEAMNSDVDVIILSHRHTMPFNEEYNKEYFDVFVRWHRITFDGQRVPEVGEIS
jgi:hypothetical protein